jgi:hypothetical protein
LAQQIGMKTLLVHSQFASLADERWANCSVLALSRLLLAILIPLRGHEGEGGGGMGYIEKTLCERVLSRVVYGWGSSCRISIHQTAGLQHVNCASKDFWECSPVQLE